MDHHLVGIPIDPPPGRAQPEPRQHQRLRIRLEDQAHPAVDAGGVERAIFADDADAAEAGRQQVDAGPGEVGDLVVPTGHVVMVEHQAGVGPAIDEQRGGAMPVGYAGVQWVHCGLPVNGR